MIFNTCKARRALKIELLGKAQPEQGRGRLEGRGFCSEMVPFAPRWADPRPGVSEVLLFAWISIPPLSLNLTPGPLSSPASIIAGGAWPKAGLEPTLLLGCCS